MGAWVYVFFLQPYPSLLHRIVIVNIRLINIHGHRGDFVNLSARIINPLLIFFMRQ